MHHDETFQSISAVAGLDGKADNAGAALPAFAGLGARVNADVGVHPGTNPGTNPGAHQGANLGANLGANSGAHQANANAPSAAAHPDDALFSQRLEARLRQEHATRQEQREAEIRSWHKEVANDPVLGGENLPASVARAQLALDRFDKDKTVGRFLNESGYGNHPAVLRFFNRMADALMEDNLVQGRPGGGMPPLEERMYAGWSSRG